MYYLNIIKILENKGKLSSKDIKLEYIKRYGRCNRTSLTRALKMLRKHNKVNMEVYRRVGHRGLTYLYSLK